MSRGSSGGAGGRRVNRMAALIRSELSQLLLTEVSDPRLRALVVTDVEVSGDLQHARVHFTPGGNEKETRAGLVKAVPFLRRRLGDRLQLRFVPELKFHTDTHTDQVMRLEQMLVDLGKENKEVPNE